MEFSYKLLKQTLKNHYISLFTNSEGKKPSFIMNLSRVDDTALNNVLLSHIVPNIVEPESACCRYNNAKQYC